MNCFANFCALVRCHRRRCEVGQKPFGQFLERLARGAENGDAPVAHPDAARLIAAAAQCGNQLGAHQRGLAAAGIAKHGHDRRLAESVEQIFRFLVSPEEQPRVARLECLESAEGAVVAPIGRVDYGVLSLQRGHQAIDAVGPTNVHLLLLAQEPWKAVDRAALCD
jgi:hypothetical protein